MTAHVKALGYASYNQKKGDPKGAIKRHIKYIEQDKDHHQNKPVLFNDKDDYVNRIQFYQKINAQPNRGVVGHKLVLTMSEEEWREDRIDLKELTRETMASYSMQQKKKLDWVASIHQDKGHPHAHIVIRGVDDRGRQVGMYPKNIKELQKIAEQQRERLAERNKAREIERDERDLLQELANERTLSPAPHRDHKIERER